MRPNDIWRYREESWSGTDLRGYAVEAADGSVGTVEGASADLGAEYVLVVAGALVLGSRTMLPAGLIDRVEVEAQRLHVHCTRRQIREAPDFDEAMYREQNYRDKLSAHYGPG